MGSGYRTFTAGEVLTASNVQNFLQDQVVMVFADSTARATSIGTANFEEGMVSYLENSDTVEVYNGTTWGSIAPVSSQGLTLINTTTFSAVSSFSLPANTFTSTYDNYLIMCEYTVSTSLNLTLRMRLAGSDDSTSNYNRQLLTADGSSVIAALLTNQTGVVFGFSGSGRSNFKIDLFSPAVARPTTGQSYLGENASTTGGASRYATFGHNVSTAYDSASVILSAGNMTGTYSVYGYNK
jgi:hypothetical protein